MSSQQIYVSIVLGEKTHKAGNLWFHQRGARQSASFEYDPDWLKHSEENIIGTWVVSWWGAAKSISQR